MTAQANERKERERVRDAIRDMGVRTADWMAGADLNRVEVVTDRPWPRVQFERNPETLRCECKAHLIPLPTFTKRHGQLPTWFCPVCSLDLIVDACERIKSEAVAS